MISRKTDPIAAIAAYALLIVGAILLLLAAYQKQHWDSDIFWALESGQWILDNLRVPRADPFSYTFSGGKWVDFTWGFQVVAWLLFSRFEWTGLFVLQLALGMVTFAALYWNLKSSSARVWLAAAATFLVFAASYHRFLIRPHLFAFLFISLYLLLLGLFERRGKNWYLWALLPLQVLWVNVHSSAILGIFIAGAFAAGHLIDGVRRGGLRARFTAETKRLVLVAAVLPLVSLLNPYGAELVMFPFAHQSPENADALRHIAEWRRIKINQLLFYLWPVPVNGFSFRVFAIGSVLAVIANHRRMRTRDVILLAGAFYMAASHVRFLAQFTFFAAPVLVENLSMYLDDRRSTLRTLKWSALGVAFLAAVIITTGFFSVEGRENAGLGIKPGVYPERTVEFIKRNSIRGNLYNSYVFGGFVTWALYPEVRPFIDGRTPTVYSPYHFWKSRVASTDQGAWRRLAEEHGLTMALVKVNRPLCSALWDEPGWRAVSFDDISALFLREVPEYSGLLDSFALRSVNPCSVESRYELPEDAIELAAMREELLGVASREGPQAARPLRLLGLVDTELGGEHLEEAARVLGEAVDINPRAHTYYDLGLALGKLKRYDEALGAFDKALERDEGSEEALLGAGLTLNDAGRHRRAVKYLKKYAYIADDKAKHLGLKTLGRACFETGDLECAETYLRRAAFIAEDEAKRAECYYYLGNAYYARREYDAGDRYYLKAARLVPRYLGAFEEMAKGLQGGGDQERLRRTRHLVEEGYERRKSRR